MTLTEATEGAERRVVFSTISGCEQRGVLKFTAAGFAWVRYDRTLIAKATCPELLTFEEAS